MIETPIFAARYVVYFSIEIWPNIQPSHTSDPLIAPDESFLIFHSNRPGGFGIKDKDVNVIHCDLYISFNEAGKWTKPINMGDQINTTGIEMAPALTPDGKYFLFTRRESINTSKPSAI